MADFPAIQLPSKCTERFGDPVIRTEFESGIVHTRPRFTRIRRSWNLSWDLMNNKDYQTLKAFYLSVLGGGTNFNWTHPHEGTAYNVRFKEELQADTEPAWYWRVSIQLEQV